MTSGSIMKTLICLVVLAVHSTLVWSNKCPSPSKKLCLPLCCEKWQFYSADSHQCERLPEEANITWQANVTFSDGLEIAIDTSQFFEYEIISPSGMLRAGKKIVAQQLDRLYCLAQYYPNGTDQLILTPFILQSDFEKMDQKLSSHLATIVPIYLTRIAVKVLLVLPTVFGYTTIKEFRQNIRIKMFLCYVTTLLIAEILVIPFSYHLYHNIVNNMEEGFLSTLTVYFQISSNLWLNAICFEIWHSYRQTNAQPNLRTDQIRFASYSTYAWGMAVLLTLLKAFIIDTNLASTHWALVVIIVGAFNLFMYLIVNVLVFLTLSVKICITRLRVANLKTEKHYNCKTVTIMLRLFAMMGMSQIIAAIAVHFTAAKDGIIVQSIFSTLDVVLIFIFFVMKRKVREMLQARYGCCREEQGNNARASEEVVLSNVTS